VAATLVSAGDESNTSSVKAAAKTDPTAFELNAAFAATLDVAGFDVGAAGALNLDFSDADIETFTLEAFGSASGTLTATASAAASSTVAGAIASVTATNEDNSIVTLTIDPDSQTNLRAIVLNNVAGENQLATAVNIESGVDSASGLQENTINQSWGSTYDWTFAPGGVTATAAVGTGGAGGSGGKVINAGAMIPCILNAGDCGTVTANGGDGGDGFADAAAASFDNIPLTIAADKITKVSVVSSGDAFVDVSEIDKSLTTLLVQTESQTDLAALILNNVAGRNQVATAINVASNGAVVIGNKEGVALVVFDSTQSGAASLSGLNQSNTINQYRGTPFQQ
jgi:hypothetical protein